MSGPPQIIPPSEDVEKVNKNKTDVDVVEQVTEVMESAKRATVDDFLKLPEVRIASAVPFEIPGTGLEVLLAGCDQIEMYKNAINAMKIMQTEDMDERAELMRSAVDSIIMSCVVDPPLTKEALEALNKYNSTGVMALADKCKQVSGMEQIDTGLMETFS